MAKYSRNEHLPVDLAAALHRKLFHKFQDRISNMVLMHLRSGGYVSETFGLIMDMDDQIWRSYVKLADDRVVNSGPSTDPTKVKHTYCALISREYLTVILNVLPKFSSYFNKKPDLGYVNVLVLAGGRATPYTLHWSQDLKLRWDI